MEPQDIEVHEISDAAADLELSSEGRTEEKAKGKEEKDKENVKDNEKEKPKEKDTEKKAENEKDKGKGLDGTSLDALLQRLPGCVSRDLIDQLTVEFCYLNSKSNRKKLVRALFNVPRTSLELLPYYSRLVATLSTCMKDVPVMLLSMLEEDFNFLINKKDMFAELRPKMTRYSTIEEVNAALMEVEENDHNASTDKISGDKHSDSEYQNPSSQTTIPSAANGRNAANGVEENGRAHDEALDNESHSDSGSIEPEGHDDEEELLSDDKSNDGSDGDDENDVASDDEDNVQVRQKVVQVDPREEEDFDRELRAVMQESLDSRQLELRARPTLNMMIPMNLFEGSTKDSRTIEGESGGETMDEEGSEGNNKVRVKVLVKKGSKQLTKQMYIPKECSLIQSTKQKEAEELEEKQSIKRRILEYHEREEEESNGFSSVSNSWLLAGSGNTGVGSSSSRPVGRGNWDCTSRGGFRQQRHHSTGGFYHGYVRRR